MCSNQGSSKLDIQPHQFQSLGVRPYHSTFSQLEWCSPPLPLPVWGVRAAFFLCGRVQAALGHLKEQTVSEVKFAVSLHPSSVIVEPHLCSRVNKIYRHFLDKSNSQSFLFKMFLVLIPNYLRINVFLQFKIFLLHFPLNYAKSIMHIYLHSH